MNNFDKISIGLIVGSSIFLCIITISLVSFFWTPHDISVLNISEKFVPIGHGKYVLGTDHFGRDILSMLMIGGRTSIWVATTAVLIGVLIGVPFGLLAASSSSKLTQDLVMRGGDLIFAFPALVTAILVTAVFGPSAVNAIIAIGIFNIPVFARITRASALPIFTLDYVLAARAAGKTNFKISFEHILPNIMSLIIVQCSIQLSLGIIAEAGLSFLGLGVQPPLASWGRMLAESQTMISFAPGVAIAPGLAIIISVFGINLFGDGIQEFANPKNKSL